MFASLNFVDIDIHSQIIASHLEFFLFLSQSGFYGCVGCIFHTQRAGSGELLGHTIHVCTNGFESKRRDKHTKRVHCHANLASDPWTTARTGLRGIGSTRKHRKNEKSEQENRKFEKCDSKNIWIVNVRFRLLGVWRGGCPKTA
jgi:hypothetical protein